MSSSPLQDELNNRPEKREWLPLGAFVFVIFALVVLAVTPVVLLKRISTETDSVITTILPTTDALRALVFAMEERISSARSGSLTGDTVYGARLAAAKINEAEALRSIQDLVPRIGSEAAGHVASLRTYMLRRDSVEAELIKRGSVFEEYRAALPLFNVLRDSMLIELAGLRRELTEVTDAQIAEVTRLSDLEETLSAALGALAVFAAAIVGWFAYRQQRLRRQLQTALAEADRRREQLEKVTESRVKLLRGITHDVKNPLGAAKGYAEILEMGIKAPMSPAQAPLVDGIRRSVDSALAIIAELLDLARADSAGLALHCAEADLNEVARIAAADHRPAAEKAGHTIDVQLGTATLPVYTDAARVTQILANLLTNAIKYTPPPGRITVRVSAGNGRETPGASSSALIQVSDSGPGIPKSQREAIFDEFTRLEENSAQKGHGLGLAIARRIARMLGGDLTVEDSAAGGATFALWLPVSPPGIPRSR